MSPTTATPSPLPGDPRGVTARLWDDPESRSTLVGLLGVIVFYLLVWLVAPYLLRHIEDLRQAYEMKVEDLARETTRAALGETPNEY